MPLSVNSLIGYEHIVSIKSLKRSKIWLLTGTADDQVVIKFEGQISAAHYKSIKPAVKAVDASAKMKALKPAEMSALRSYITNVKRAEASHADLRFFGADEVKAVTELGEMIGYALRSKRPFVKMKPHQMIDLKEAVASSLAGDPGNLKLLKNLLKGKGGLEQFGEIIAADLFNQNRDRMSPVGSPVNATIQGHSFRLKAIANIGNVFAAMEKGGSKFKFSALDSADPSALADRLFDTTTPLSHLENKGLDFKWDGRVLADRTRRRKFAGDIVDDLEALLHPKRSKVGLIRALGSRIRTIKRLDQGMVSGARKILSYFDKKGTKISTTTTTGKQLTAMGERIEILRRAV